jgi:hypothetical protein
MIYTKDFIKIEREKERKEFWDAFFGGIGTFILILLIVYILAFI